MDCEICQQLNTSYQHAVASLHVANQRVRLAHSGSVEAAVARREMKARLHDLIKAEAEMKAHTAAHIAALASMEIPHAVHA